MGLLVATRLWTMELTSAGRLVPWLLWGGRLGVGEHRICGAGCWEVICLA